MKIRNIFNVLKRENANTNTEKSKKTAKSVILSSYINRSIKDLEDLKTAYNATLLNPARFYYLQQIYKNIVDFDTHLNAVLLKRSSNIFKQKLVIKNANDEIITERLTQDINFNNLIITILEAKFFGFSGIEINIVNNMFNFYEIPRLNINPTTQEIFKNITDIKGYNINEFEDAYIIKDRDIRGLLLRCAYAAILKRNALADWANLIQLYGQPIMEYTYSEQFSGFKNKLAEITQNIGSNAEITLPEGVQSKVIFPNASGRLQYDFVDFLNKEVSKIVLGQTLTTDEGSSYSQANIHKVEQNIIFESDKQFIIYYLNIILSKYLKQLVANAEKIEFYTDADINTEIDKDLKLKQLLSNNAYLEEYLINKYLK